MSAIGLIISVVVIASFAVVVAAVILRERAILYDESDDEATGDRAP